LGIVEDTNTRNHIISSGEIWGRAVVKVPVRYYTTQDTRDNLEKGWWEERRAPGGKKTAWIMVQHWDASDFLSW
jgi:hypothetical protein